jgi:hypothetical protein
MDWTGIYNFFVNLDSNVIPMVKGSAMTFGALAAIFAWAVKKTPWKWDDKYATLVDDVENLKKKWSV